MAKRNIKYAIIGNKAFGTNEVAFEAKPTKKVLEAIKALRMRWNRKTLRWYGWVEVDALVEAIGNEPTTVENPQKIKAKTTTKKSTAKKPAAKKSTASKSKTTTKKAATAKSSAKATKADELDEIIMTIAEEAKKTTAKKPASKKTAKKAA